MTPHIHSPDLPDYIQPPSTQLTQFDRANSRMRNESPLFHALNETFTQKRSNQSTRSVNIRQRPKSGIVSSAQQSFRPNRFQEQLSQCTNKFMMLNRILSNAAFSRKRQFLRSQMLQSNSLSRFGKLNTMKEP